MKDLIRCGICLRKNQKNSATKFRTINVKECDLHMHLGSFALRNRIDMREVQNYNRFTQQSLSLVCDACRRMVQHKYKDTPFNKDTSIYFDYFDNNCEDEVNIEFDVLEADIGHVTSSDESMLSPRESSPTQVESVDLSETLLLDDDVTIGVRWDDDYLTDSDCDSRSNRSNSSSEPNVTLEVPLNYMPEPGSKRKTIFQLRYKRDQAGCIFCHTQSETHLKMDWIQLWTLCEYDGLLLRGTNETDYICHRCFNENGTLLKSVSDFVKNHPQTKRKKVDPNDVNTWPVLKSKVHNKQEMYDYCKKIEVFSPRNNYFIFVQLLS